MTLYLNGQDIRRFVAYLFTEQGAHAHVDFSETEPELFLAHVDKFLNDQKLSLNNIKRIIAVIGPGSSTSLRTTLSIVNTIGMARGIPLAGVEKAMEERDEEVVVELLKGEREIVAGVPFLAPSYAHEPRITETKKDRLGRRN